MAYNPWNTLGYVTGDKRSSQVYVSDPKVWEEYYRQNQRHQSGSGIKDTKGVIPHNKDTKGVIPLNKDNAIARVEDRIREQHDRKIKEGKPRVTDGENQRKPI